MKIYNRLNNLDKIIGRKRSNLVKKAVGDFLEEQEDYFIALRRLEEKNPRISLEQLEEEMKMNDITTKYTFLKEVKNYKMAEAQIELNLMLNIPITFARFDFSYIVLDYLTSIPNLIEIKSTNELNECFQNNMRVFKVDKNRGIFEINNEIERLVRDNYNEEKRKH